MKLIDISLPVHRQMPTYPGDQPTEIDQTVKPSGSRISKLTVGSHAGTHIDAPSHSLPDDKRGVDSYPLDVFYGACRVVEIAGSTIDKSQLIDQSIRPAERILFKTSNSARGYDQFYDNWVGLTPEAADYLASLPVALVGIDWLGIKRPQAPDNRAHTALLTKSIPILEGLDLSQASAGEYTLSALPVAYRGTDGAPTRAVLIADS